MRPHGDQTPQRPTDLHLMAKKRENASSSDENINATKFQRESSTCLHQTWSSLVSQKIIPNLMITSSPKDYSKILMNILG